MTLEELITRLKHIPDRYLGTRIEIEPLDKFYQVGDINYFDKPTKVIMLTGEEIND